MASKIQRLSILFADISGSTRLFEQLGDAKARGLVAECLGTLSDVTTRHGGRVIKTIGDEVMCTFPDADTAVRAACEMHELVEDPDAVARLGWPVPRRIRVGLHHGEAIVEGGDIFGDAVNVAARMTAQSKGGQIITTRPTANELCTSLRASTRLIDRAPVKGKREAMDIYEVIWRLEDVTHMPGPVPAPRDRSGKLSLTYRELRFELDDAHPGVNLGRSNAVDLTVDEILASREHARIEYRRGKFFIIDESTNGTYIRGANGEESFVHREEVPLTGAGEISLGRAFGDDPQELVQFLARC